MSKRAGMLPCRKVITSLATELEKRTKSVERHLARCPNCRAYFDSLRKTVILYRRWLTQLPAGSSNQLKHHTN
jgi:predicted anti-sigma-YlaC factor YlaD